MLPHSDLVKLADWEPIASGFGRDGRLFEKRLTPLFSAIGSLEKAQVHLLNTGGLSNYASVFVHRRRGEFGAIDGLYVCISLLGPYAAIGRMVAYLQDTSQAYSMIEPHEVLRRGDLQSPFEEAVFSAVETGGFHLLTPDEASVKLPADVQPYEYCLNAEPWDRVFHVLFSDTD